MRRNATIWTAWFGPLQLPPYMQLLHEVLVRQASLSGIDVVLLRDADVSTYLPTAHAGFPRLSYVHRADYARAYLLHAHGGMWLDMEIVALRPPGRLWHACSDDGRSVPQHSAIIGPLRANSTFTRAWLGGVNKKLDKMLPLLRAHPGRECFKTSCAYEGSIVQGRALPQGYPVGWGDLLDGLWEELLKEQHKRRGAAGGNSSTALLHRASAELCVRECHFGCPLGCVNATDGRVAVPCQGADVAVGLNSHWPPLLRELNRDELLRSPTTLAQLARDALGVSAEAEVVDAMRRGEHCLNTHLGAQRWESKWACTAYANYTQRAARSGEPLLTFVVPRRGDTGTGGADSTAA